MIFLAFSNETVHLWLTRTRSLPSSHLPERPFEAKVYFLRVSSASATRPSLESVSAT